MNIYMFHYVDGNEFNYYHFDKYDFEKIIVKLISDGKKIISFSQFKKMIDDNDNNIDDCILLSFDDGTKDHYYNVYPILKKYNLSALFFVCSNIIDNKILDVNLIHRIIANSNFEELFNTFIALLKDNGITTDDYSQTIKTEYDNEKMLYFKQMLQFILPTDIKNKILMQLAYIYNVSVNFNDYYMNINQIKEMKENGMEFGFHTETHRRLEKLSYDEQYDEIVNCRELLISEKILNEDSPLSYPFGSYNEDTIDILKKNNIKYAFAINSNKFIHGMNLLNIPRFDCNVLKEKLKNEK